MNDMSTAIGGARTGGPGRACGLVALAIIGGKVVAGRMNGTTAASVRAGRAIVSCAGPIPSG